MSKDFDSVDRNLLIACLMRLHVPEELAEQMVRLDDEEQIFVKCPRNMEIAERGVGALTSILGGGDGHTTQLSQESSQRIPGTRP